MTGVELASFEHLIHVRQVFGGLQTDDPQVLGG
jgi:hypothetical protein